MTYNARIKNARNGIINVTGSVLAVTGTILSTADITASANLSASSVFTTNLTASTVSASVYLGLPGGGGGGDVTLAGDNTFTGINTFNNNYVTASVTGSDAKFTTLSSSVITASHVNVDYIDFFTGSATNPSFQSGRVYYDINSKDLQFNTEIPTVSFNLGQQLAVKVKNNSAGTINKGKLVRIIGGTGSLPVIATASYENDGNSANTLGMVMQTVTANDTSFGLLVGVIGGLNLNPATYTAGDLLYLSSSGDYTNVKPLAPLHAVRIGEVIRAHATEGAAFIKIDNGYEIEELHDVAVTNVSVGDLLVYNSSSQIWENKKVLTGSYAITGNLNITSTISASNATVTTITGSTTSGSTATFTTITGSTVTGSTAQFTTVTGSTISGTTATFTNITGTLNGTASYATNAGNAATVTNGVYTNTTNTFAGVNTFNTSYITASVGVTGSDAKFTTITASSGVINGDLLITGSARRIRGDFSDATHANRVMFQTNVTNGNTVIGIVPNGTATGTNLNVYSNTDVDNSPFGQIVNNNSEISIRSVANGTASYLPITFNTTNLERMRIDAAGNVGIGVTNPASKLFVSTSLINDGLLIYNSVSAKRVQLVPRLAVGSWNPITQDDDAGIIWNSGSTAGTSGAFVIAPWNNSIGGIRIDAAGNVGIAQTSPAAKLDVNGASTGNITAVAALNIDCSLGNFFTKTINGASTFTVSNVPASRDYAFTLELEHTSGAITWFSGVEWPGGSAPTLTTGKTHLFMFQTDNGGTRWRASSLINYTT